MFKLDDISSFSCSLFCAFLIYRGLNMVVLGKTKMSPSSSSVSISKVCFKLIVKIRRS